MRDAPRALLLAVASLTAGAACADSALSPADAAAAAVKCPLSSSLTFRWIGLGIAMDWHRLSPPARYELTRPEAAACVRPVPDCDGVAGTVDLGDVDAAVAHAEVAAAWPGTTGERLFTFEATLTDVPIFEIEADGRGSIRVSPHCDRNGCVPPPAGVTLLRGTLGRLVDRLGCP